MTFIHIKKIQTGDAEGGMKEVFAVPSVAIATPQGRKLIPNPSGNEASLFNSLEEAENAIRTAGFDYIYEGRKTYTINQGHQGRAVTVPGLSANPLEDAVPMLIQQLSDRESSVVANAAFALGALKATNALGHLSGLLGHDDPNVRKSAAESLARFGMTGLPTLRDAYRTAQASMAKNAPYIRLTVMLAFVEMGQTADVRLMEQYLPMAVEALQDESWLVRAQAALIVGRAAQIYEEEQSRRDPLGNKQRPPSR